MNSTLPPTATADVMADVGTGTAWVYSVRDPPPPPPPPPTVMACPKTPTEPMVCVTVLLLGCEAWYRAPYSRWKGAPPATMIFQEARMASMCSCVRLTLSGGMQKVGIRDGSTTRRLVTQPMVVRRGRLRLLYGCVDGLLLSGEGLVGVRSQGRGSNR